jgi:hypothetical protein
MKMSAYVCVYIYIYIRIYVCVYIYLFIYICVVDGSSGSGRGLWGLDGVGSG